MQRNSAARLEIDHRRDLAGNDAAIVAYGRLPPSRELRSLRLAEEPQLIEHRDRRRMQAAGVAVDDLDGYAPAFVSYTERLNAFGPDLGDPPAASGTHQGQIVAPLAGNHFRVGAHRAGECGWRGAVARILALARKPRIGVSQTRKRYRIIRRRAS